MRAQHFILLVLHWQEKKRGLFVLDFPNTSQEGIYTTTLTKHLLRTTNITVHFYNIFISRNAGGILLIRQQRRGRVEIGDLPLYHVIINTKYQ